MEEMLTRAADHRTRIGPVTRADTEKYGLWHWAVHVEVKKKGSDGWYLVAIREEPGPGRFEIPGGHVDWGEEPRQAACRELQEELGLVLKGNELQDGPQITNYTLYDDGRINLEFVFVYVYESATAGSTRRLAMRRAHADQPESRTGLRCRQGLSTHSGMR